LNSKLATITKEKVQMSFYSPAQKRRFAIQRGAEVRKLELEFKINNWRATHPKEWTLLAQNKGKVPFFDSLYVGLMRWGSLTHRQMLALQNFTHPSSKSTVH
jgi:hypothetical protein